MLKIYYIAYLLCLVITKVISGESSELWLDGCDPNVIVSYRMTLETYWTEKAFPKSYPRVRPPAQWSKVFGQSHNADYSIFDIGQTATIRVRKFAEKGDVADLINKKDLESIFDQFTSPNIEEGSGKSQQDFFINSNHSKISIVSKMIPSPDWFIGINGYDLCIEGKWTENENITMDLLDAGTQGGYTFTSPKWRLTDPDNITKITSDFPSNRASSFYYPELKQLPIIATMHIKKIMEHPLYDETTESSNIESITYPTENYTYSMETTTEAIYQDPIELITLSKESMDILYNVTNNHKNNLKYYPKYFRPKIIKKKTKTKHRVSGDLLKSRLPTNIKIPQSSSLYIGW